MSDLPQSPPPMPPEFSPGGAVPVERIEPFDVRDSVGMNGLTKLGIFVAVLLLAAFIGLKLYQPGTRDRYDPPRITADNTPFKVPPKEAGGAQTPNQDKAVFDVMDGQSPETKVVPQPAPEQPIRIETPTIVAPQPVVPDVRPTTPVTRPTTRPQPSVAVGNSNFVVQIASLRSQAEANATYDRLTRKFPALLSGLQPDIKRVDLAEKGIYFRARVAGLADKTAADQLCQQFKASGQDCIVTRR